MKKKGLGEMESRVIEKVKELFAGVRDSSLFSLNLYQRSLLTKELIFCNNT